MEQNKQQQSEDPHTPLQKKEDQAKPNKNKSRQLHINFHNPNTPEATAKYLSKLIIKNLAEIENSEDTID